MKHIVLCSDGTGNNDIKARGTNVFKLYEAVDIQGHKLNGRLIPQVAYYDDGVGTSRFLPLKIIGGAFGWGFTQNVKDLYIELVHVYEPGDKLFLFGFSRGAYTARTLAGLIQYCGVLRSENLTGDEIRKGVDACWKAFSKEAFKEGDIEKGERCNRLPPAVERESAGQRRKGLGAIIDDTKVPFGEVKISFLGVWDTVGALGAPSATLRTIINWFHPLRFSELTLGGQVDRACHAISIDDERRTFAPELWNEKGGDDRRISQVWFAGVHSNVGGGYPKQGISLVTLDWMMTEAAKQQLRFIPADRESVRARRDVNDKLYDSRAGLAMYYRWNPRNIAALCRAHNMGKPKIHESVLERIANGSDGYAPGNIPFDCEIVTTDSPPHTSSWPSEELLRQIESEIRRGTVGHSESPLAKMARTIQSGKHCYNVFLGATLIVLGLLSKAPYLWWAVLIFAVGVGAILLYWSDQLVDKRLADEYSMTWNAHRRSLRLLLRNHETLE